jgi:hypothetical protein
MKEFRDEEGRPWRLALTVAAALRVKDLVTIEIEDEHESDDGTVTKARRTVPFDLVDLGTIHHTLTVLRNQFSKLGEVLYAILIAQVDERKLTRDQFLEGLRGDSLEAAANALESEVVDFFPQRLRPLVAGMATKFTELTEQVVAGAKVTIQQIDVSALSGISSGKPQASSASTLESGPIGNSQLLETHA